MVVADRFEDKIRLYTEYHERHMAAQIPGASYKKDAGAWQLPLTWPSCLAMRGVFGDRLEIGEDLKAWAWNERSTRIIPSMAIRSALHSESAFPELDEIEGSHSYKLYPYQRVDTEFITIGRRVLIANPPGLGKTGVAIRSLQIMDKKGEQPYPALIVCPNSLKFTVWEDGFKQWAPDVKVQVVDGSAVKRRKQLETDAQVFIMNWESIRLHSRVTGYGSIALTESDRELKELNKLELGTVIFDEAHKLKDPTTRQTRSAWAVAHQARNRIALTGTPVADHIGDLWGILHAIEPEWFPSRTKFLDRYAQISLNYFGGAEVVGIKDDNRQELFSIIDPLMRRVPKQAALPQLPPKLPVQYRHTPMSPKQQKAYNQMRDTMLAQLNEILVAPSPLSKLTRLLQFASASAELSEVKVRTVKKSVLDPDTMQQHQVLVEEEYQDVLLTDPSAKVDDLIDLLEEMGDEPLVVGAVSRQLIELAAKRLEKHKIPHGLVTGAQSPLDRQMAVQDFQEGRSRVILLTLGAGAEGLTLTRANTMLFMQRSYSQIQNEQAEDRVHRIGSEIHDSVRIIEQITPDSVEENRRSLLAGKQIRMEDVIRDEEMLRKLLGGS